MESLINRAAIALGMGLPECEVIQKLKESGHSDWDIFFAIEAAKISNKDRERDTHVIECRKKKIPT